MPFEKSAIPWNKGKRGLQVAWNKGMKFPEFSGENNSHWKPKIEKICLQCNKEFEVFPSFKRAKYCSFQCYWKNLKGKKPWMTGKKHTKETLEKLKSSGAFFNKGHIPWNKNKKFIEISGNKHWKWKGGTSPLYETLRKSFENDNWRKKVFERDNYTCQECLNEGGYLIAHHKKPFAEILSEFLQQYSQFSPMEDKETLVRLSITYEPFWNINNGKTLCKDCHKKETFKIGG
ncbi:hypothetical protein LCGC14_0544500 [marine sediment metagenome]|uniref:Nuclease associated modular domain-containing protein n=1 Tax=marine sediment metagenome TaxID=412755 RepID=A0A0F9V041_9ZZZZ